jgi:tetratricopeptide (TPR) repeat protein
MFMTAAKPDLRPLCMQARGFAGQGRVDDALNLYGEVLRLDPDNAMAYADRGTVLAMTKQFEPALRDLEQAFRLGYADASAFSTAGTICLETKQYGKALEHYAKAAELNPDYPFTYFNRASVHFALGNKESAIADLETCLSMGGAEDFRQLVLKRMAEVRQA